MYFYPETKITGTRKKIYNWLIFDQLTNLTIFQSYIGFKENKKADNNFQFSFLWLFLNSNFPTRNSITAIRLLEKNFVLNAKTN